MATYQLGFTGTPNNTTTLADYNDVAYMTTKVESSYTLVAQDSGSCDTVYVYKGGTAVLGGVAVYDSSLNLLAEATFDIDNTTAGWNAVSVPSFSVVSGSTYYPVAMFSGLAQDVPYDDTTDNESSRIDSSTFPDPWTEAQNRSYCAGVYAEYTTTTGEIQPDDTVLTGMILSSPEVSGGIGCDNIVFNSIELSSPTATASGTTTIPLDTLELNTLIFGSTAVSFEGEIGVDDIALNTMTLSSPTVSPYSSVSNVFMINESVTFSVEEL